MRTRDPAVIARTLLEQLATAEPEGISGMAIPLDRQPVLGELHSRHLVRHEGERWRITDRGKAALREGSPLAVGMPSG